jgi:hypothetical protein
MTGDMTRRTELGITFVGVNTSISDSHRLLTSSQGGFIKAAAHMFSRAKFGTRPIPSDSVIMCLDELQASWSLSYEVGQPLRWVFSPVDMNNGSPNRRKAWWLEFLSSSFIISLLWIADAFVLEFSDRPPSGLEMESTLDAFSCCPMRILISRR